MVPAAIDSMIFFLHTCIKKVNATAMNCCKASADNDKCQLAMSIATEVRRQYTTNRAKTEAGNILPKYMIYLGVGLSGRNAMNGMNRVSIVATTAATIIMICWVIFIAHLPFVFYKW